MKTKTKKKTKTSKELKHYAKELDLDNMLVLRPSKRSVRLLERIAKFGVYGRDKEEVALRMIDHNIAGFCETEDFKLKG